MANSVGKPLRYKTVEELQKVIDEYFAYCDNRTVDVYVKDLGDNITISKPAPYTMAGLARYIGLSRQALLDYSNRDTYLDAIKESRLKVEEYNEIQLHEGRSAVGSIFNLKCNFGWKDNVDDTSQEIHITFRNEVPSPKEK